ncbi:FG-GAP repeat protein [filamentous cyanobacterium LEGE 11480]|uniref:FG-GAP repeat protein n=1 Tax=Romeriopsis navalis LEGE 11480 TaxID=2777977 RepID=A0A928VTC4_9CYAN|nr:CAP domain-containing protein [Romeriopsis navalis]MBE9032200.1 FG-GAP repeat protein [Romeriopsis navalis LEGE 11480]
MPNPLGNTLSGALQSDLVWRNQATGADAIWHLNRTNFAFNSTAPQAGQDFTNLLSVADPTWEIKGTGDFNGDKKSDIVWRHRTSGTNIVWYFNESQFIRNPGAPQLGIDFDYLPSLADPNWDIQAIGDFNNDGSDDLVWRHQTLGQNAVWYLQNNQFVRNPGAPQLNIDFAYFPSMPDQNWQIKGSADFNGDGRADLVWRNQATGENAVWFLNNTQFVNNPGAPQLGQDFAYLPSITDPNWDIVAIGQFNGDDQADLVWRNRVTGDNVVWFLNGTNFAVNPGAPQAGQDFAYLPRQADTNWQIVGAIHRNPTNNTTSNTSGSTLATAFNLGTVNGLRAVQESISAGAANDYWRLDVSNQQSINVLLNNLSANADLQLLDASGNRVTDAFNRNGEFNSGTTAEVRSRILDPGTYYLRVYGNNTNTNYQLSILGLAATTNYTDRVVEITNFYRTQSGLNALQKNTNITNAAQAHSQSMALDDFFEHTGLNGSSTTQRVQAAGYNGVAAENIAAGQLHAEHAMERWMYSSGHRANILNANYQDIGVGYYYLAQDGGTERWQRYWTSNFGIRS